MKDYQDQKENLRILKTWNFDKDFCKEYMTSQLLDTLALQKPSESSTNMYIGKVWRHLYATTSKDVISVNNIRLTDIRANHPLCQFELQTILSYLVKYLWTCSYKNKLLRCSRWRSFYNNHTNILHAKQLPFPTGMPTNVAPSHPDLSLPSTRSHLISIDTTHNLGPSLNNKGKGNNI